MIVSFVGGPGDGTTEDWPLGATCRLLEIERATPHGTRYGFYYRETDSDTYYWGGEHVEPIANRVNRGESITYPRPA